jgi:predicted aldo/keto reductase-like oxidoreductase
MNYREFGKNGIHVSALGFGSMRLPMMKVGANKFVDMDRAVETIRLAFEKGVNYIDSAWGYCAAESEFAVGRALRGWRDKVYVTTKAARWSMTEKGDLRRMLEHQLQKLGTDYMDFYCFHDTGWDVLHEMDEKTGWIGDMMKAHEEGLVKHVAISSHDKPENIIRLIDLGYFDMLTCQYNYLDRKNEEVMAHASEKGLGVVVMGPVGGGRLAALPEFLQDEQGLDTSSAAGLAIRFVLSNPNVNVALSGMGSTDMVEENVAAAEAGPLTDSEKEALDGLLEKTKKMADLYCTGCGYCMPCKQGVKIPARFEAMNMFSVYGLKEHAKNRYRNIRRNEKNSEGGGECIECGECEEKCPQHISIIEQLKETDAALGD